MCSPAILVPIAMGATAVSGGYQMYSQYQQGVGTKNLYEYQAAQAREEGKAAIQAGEKQSNLIQDTAKAEGKKLSLDQSRFSASQRATMAALGICLNT